MVALALAAVLVVGVVAVGVAWARRSSRATPFLTATPNHTTTRAAYGTPPAGPDGGAPAALDLRSMSPGTALRVRGDRYVVRGTLVLTEGRDAWSEHLLEADGPGPRRYLSVAAGETVLWTHAPDVVATPGRQLVVDGVEHVRTEHGHARYRSEGVTGVAGSGRVRYHDYAAADGSRLSLEEFDDTGLWECARGRLLALSDVVPDGVAAA